MTEPDRDAEPAPSWLPWVCLGLLTLPFHPLWIDFEQVRRGALLVLAGALFAAHRRLPKVQGGKVGLLLVCSLVLSAGAQAVSQYLAHGGETPWSFQPWEAAYRVAHWLALLVLIRAGATMPSAAFAAPVATLLLVTCGFGLLQRLGVAEWSGYGVEREPVSTFGNLNVASEWTAVALAAVAALWPRYSPRRRWLAVAALALAGAYLYANPSRSGKVAALTSLTVLALLRRRERGWLPLAVAAGGALLGAVATFAVALPVAQGQAMQQELERGTVTLQVRFEIAAGTAELLKESPVLGQGPGQFAVEYPRHRTEAEIEASSFGRQFSTEVRNAHDDWLELLVDGGLPALVLFGLLLFALQRGPGDRSVLLPMFAVLLLMFVRAPLLNAPVAALAFLLAGTRLHPVATAAPTRARRVSAVALGLSMVVLGALPVLGNTAFTDYLRALRTDASPDQDAVTAAAGWMPFEPRWRELQARAAMAEGDLQQAAHLAAKALELRPFSPPLLLLLGEVLARGSRYGEAIRVARRGLELDPANPELHALVSTAQAELGDVDRAVREVVVEPHPALRAALAQHFLDLATRAEQRAEQRQANRYLIEHLFVAIADRSGSEDAEETALVGELQRRLTRELQRFERDQEDLRWLFTGALAALDLGKEELAAGYAAAAEKKGARLSRWQRELLGGQLDRLRALPAWRALLGG